MEEKTMQKPSTTLEAIMSRKGATRALSIPEIVDRLESLVRYALECEEKPLKDDVSFVEVYRQLLGVQKAIAVLDRDQRDLIEWMAKVADVPPEQLPHCSPTEKKSFDKLKGLEKMCEEARSRLHDSMAGQELANKEIKEQVEESTISEKKKVIRRKGKFKKMGGAGWVRS